MSPHAIAAIRAVGGPGEYCINLLSSLLPSDGEQITFLLGDTRLSFNKEIICSLSPLLSNLLQDMARAGCCCANGNVFISLPLEMSPTSVLCLQTVLQDGAIHNVDSNVREHLKDAIRVLGMDIDLVEIQEDVDHNAYMNAFIDFIHIKPEPTENSIDHPSNTDYETNSQLNETMELGNNSYHEADYFDVNCIKIENSLEYTEVSTDLLFGNNDNFMQEEESITSLNHIENENLVQTGSVDAEEISAVESYESDKNNNNNVLLRMTRNMNCKVNLKRLDKRSILRKCDIKLKKLDMESSEGLEEFNAWRDLELPQSDGAVRSDKIVVQIRNTEGNAMHDIKRKKIVTQMRNDIEREDESSPNIKSTSQSSLATQTVVTGRQPEAEASTSLKETSEQWKGDNTDDGDDGKVHGPSYSTPIDASNTEHIMENVEKLAKPLTMDAFEYESEVDSEELDIQRLIGFAIKRLNNDGIEDRDDMGPTFNSDEEVIEKHIELVPKINIKRTLGLEAWWVQEPDSKGEEKFVWKPYSKEEDERIILYMKKNHLHGRQRGRKNWQRMEEENVCPGRSWQSMKERWIKRIEGSVEDFDQPDG